MSKKFINDPDHVVQEMLEVRVCRKVHTALCGVFLHETAVYVCTLQHVAQFDTYASVGPIALRRIPLSKG